MSNKVDRSYWESLIPPLSPSDEDVNFYRENILPGDTLLLGSTRKLLPLSTTQLDLDPWYTGPNMIIGDWRDNKIHYKNIIGDGVLVLDKALSYDVLEMCSKYSDVFVCRSFNRKLDAMRVATYFPHAEDFHIPPTKIKVLEDYSFFVWHF